MKHKTLVALIIAPMILGVGLYFLVRDGREAAPISASAGASSPVLDKNQVTIRNVTKETVTYTIKPASSSAPAGRKALTAGGLDRYSGRKRLILAYRRLGNEITETLLPGTPYSFRYDENGLIHLYLGSHMREDAEDLAPYIATPMEVVFEMLEMARVGASDTVYDLGCGDGRMVVLAAEKYGARGVGIDIDPRRIKEAEARAEKAGVRALVTFRVEDAAKSDFSEATVLALYLLPESNALLRPKFESLLQPGARVVTHNYPVPGWDERRLDSKAVKDKTGKNHTIFLYRR